MPGKWQRGDLKLLVATCTLLYLCKVLVWNFCGHGRRILSLTHVGKRNSRGADRLYVHKYSKLYSFTKTLYETYPTSRESPEQVCMWACVCIHVCVHTRINVLYLFLKAKNGTESKVQWKHSGQHLVWWDDTDNSVTEWVSVWCGAWLWWSELWARYIVLHLHSPFSLLHNFLWWLSV